MSEVLELPSSLLFIVAAWELKNAMEALRRSFGVLRSDAGKFQVLRFAFASRAELWSGSWDVESLERPSCGLNAACMV